MQKITFDIERCNRKETTECEPLQLTTISCTYHVLCICIVGYIGKDLKSIFLD